MKKYFPKKDANKNLKKRLENMKKKGKKISFPK
jgi:hypothetical protein